MKRYLYPAIGGDAYARFLVLAAALKAASSGAGIVEREAGVMFRYVQR
jgi:hypothetical protein